MRSSVNGCAAFLLAAFCGIVSISESKAGEHNSKKPPEVNAAVWRYVVPAPGDRFEHPPLQAVALADEKPEDLTEAADYRGNRRWYGQIRYGTPNSTCVAAVVDESRGREFDLYVDLNRNRIIEAKERIDGRGDTRRVPMPAELTHEDVAEYVARSVIFRRGTSGKALGFATIGYVEGSVRIGQRPVQVRRVDGDGNGLFADSRDRIWFDWNGDGQWDDFAEQFPFTPIVTLDEERIALRCDAVGSRMTAEPVVGVGRIRLQLKPQQPNARVRSLEVTLEGDDGSAFAVRGADRSITVPVGRYALLSVTLSVEHAATKTPWHFVFSRSDRPADDQWFDVGRDADVAVDALGRLRFVLEARDLAAEVTAGQRLAVKPRLYTAAGLLINSSRCGETVGASDENSSCASVVLQMTDGTPLSSAKTGFS